MAARTSQAAWPARTWPDTIGNVDNVDEDRTTTTRFKGRTIVPGGLTTPDGSLFRPSGWPRPRESILPSSINHWTDSSSALTSRRNDLVLVEQDPTRTKP